jgi:hypothetical protein
VTLYGKLPSDKLVEELDTVRKIAREISLFEISDRQRMFLIYLLALELENITAVQDITTIVRELGGADIFLIEKGG